jgi:hypothetical protein
LKSLDLYGAQGGISPIPHRQFSDDLGSSSCTLAIPVVPRGYVVLAIMVSEVVGFLAALFCLPSHPAAIHLPGVFLAKLGEEFRSEQFALRRTEHPDLEFVAVQETTFPSLAATGRK